MTSCSPHCGINNVDCKTYFNTTHTELDDDNNDVDDDGIKVVRVSLLIFDHFYIPCVA